jgi:hypothetical protein
VIAMPSQGLQDFNLTEQDFQSGDIESLSLINRVPLDVFEVLAKMTSGQTGVKQKFNRVTVISPINLFQSLGTVLGLLYLSKSYFKIL